VPAALVSTMLATAPLGSADATVRTSVVAERPPGGHVVSAPAPRTAREVRRYWTPERMAAAAPVEDLLPDLAVPGPDASSSRGPHRPEPTKVRAPRSTGKLFFSDNGLDYVCSAAAIDTRRRNQVITAGHCVHTGPHPEGLLVQPHYYSDWLFVPRYRNGNAPLGRWAATSVRTFRGWTDQESFRFDQAIISFARRGRQRLVDVVGGNEVVWGKRQRERGVRIWGWPAEAPYDGETARRCDGRTTRFEDTADAAMRQCDLNGGASGGPWFLPRGRTTNTGRIWAVTSRRIIGRPVLLARPIPREIRRIIRAANR
jgi:V8-like Glu-specific endopeptidase